MIFVQWWDYPVWALAGALVVTYLGPGRAAVRGSHLRGVLGELLSLLTVGCPLWNKLVLFAVGVSGALSWLAPAQPLLGVVSVVLLPTAMRRRRRGLRTSDFMLAA